MYHLELPGTTQGVHMPYFGKHWPTLETSLQAHLPHSCHYWLSHPQCLSEARSCIPASPGVFRTLLSSTISAVNYGRGVKWRRQGTARALASAWGGDLRAAARRTAGQALQGQCSRGVPGQCLGRLKGHKDPPKRLIDEWQKGSVFNFLSGDMDQVATWENRCIFYLQFFWGEITGSLGFLFKSAQNRGREMKTV